MPRQRVASGRLSSWRAAVLLALLACAPAEGQSVRDTCTSAGGECVRAGGPLGARRPPEATCIDYGTWERGRPYAYRDGLSDPPLTCPGTPEVCCFPSDAGP